MTPLQNAILVVLIALGGVLTYLFAESASRGARIGGFVAYVVVIAVVAGVFRLRFERMRHK